jgi:uncharacterized protein
MDRNIALIKSSFLHSVKRGGIVVIWHSLFGYPKVISVETLDFINSFISPKRIADVFEEINIDDPTEAIISELIESYFLVPDNINEREILNKINEERLVNSLSGSQVSYLELIVSEKCNFGCVYCIHFNNLEFSERFNHKKLMDFETAKKAVDIFMKVLFVNGKRIAEINFGGGEPLLNWKVIKRIMDYCIGHYGQNFQLKFSINTNASLIVDEIALILKQNQVGVASSLDGLKEGNDLVRLTKTGKGTFDSITKGFEVLRKNNYPLEGFAVTINELNFSQLDESIINWAKMQGFKDVRIDIDVIGLVKVSINDIVTKIISIYQYAKKQNIYVTGFWARPVENLNETILTNKVAFCGGVRGDSLCINPSGNIYYCGYSSQILGNISDFQKFFSTEGGYATFLRSRVIGSLPFCHGCFIEGQCGGGCQITWEHSQVQGSEKIKRMCDFYRQMTIELLFDQLSD